jgi:hypothetical protein
VEGKRKVIQKIDIRQDRYFVSIIILGSRVHFISVSLDSEDLRHAELGKDVLKRRMRGVDEPLVSIALIKSGISTRYVFTVKKPGRKHMRFHIPATEYRELGKALGVFR